MKEIIDSSVVHQMTNQIFDRFASTEPIDETGASIESCRAIAAASILAFSRGVYNWHELLDEAMEERGVSTHFSDLIPEERRRRCRMVAGAVGEMTRSCRSVTEILTVLNTD